MFMCFFIIECYINMFIECTYNRRGECCGSCGNGTQQYRVKCPKNNEFDVDLDCVSYRNCTGKYDKYQHDNL